MEKQENYSGDLMTLNMGQQRIVIVNGYAAIDEAMRHPYMSGRPDNRLKRLLLDCDQDSMFLNQGDTWAFTRRIGVQAIAMFMHSKHSREWQKLPKLQPGG